MVSEARGSFICVKIFSEYESIFIEENFRKKKFLNWGNYTSRKIEKRIFGREGGFVSKKKFQLFYSPDNDLSCCVEILKIS